MFVVLAFVVLMISQSGPVGAQTDPLAGQTVNIEATTIGPIAVADCAADPNATVVSLTVADADNDATQETFTDGVNADFQFGSQGITITPRGAILAISKALPPAPWSVLRESPAGTQPVVTGATVALVATTRTRLVRRPSISTTS